MLPGEIIVSILATELAGGDIAEWCAVEAVLVSLSRTEYVLVALVAGVGTVLFFFR